MDSFISFIFPALTRPVWNRFLDLGTQLTKKTIHKSRCPLCYSTIVALGHGGITEGEGVYICPKLCHAIYGQPQSGQLQLWYVCLVNEQVCAMEKSTVEGHCGLCVK